MSKNKIAICVYCGSRPGAKPEYMEAARETGEGIGQRGWELVYGAGDIGIMGEVARTAQAAGAKALGVIPVHLTKDEVARHDVDQLIITENMHERKKVMFMNSEALIILPGGAGTLDEFFEGLTWAQLGLHKKPIVLVNIEGYWDPLVTLVDSVIGQGFADESLKGLFTVVDTVEDAFAYLEDYIA